MLERMKEVMETLPATRRFKTLEELTGIPAQQWTNIFHARQKANHEHIEAMCKAFPHYTYWLGTGMTDEANGHTSPILERIQRDLEKVRRAG